MGKYKKSKWSYEMIRVEALKYSTRMEFRDAQPTAYAVAVAKRWLSKVCEHMPDQSNKWTFERLFTEALKYSSFPEFIRGNRAAYIAAGRREGCLDKITSHMGDRVGRKVTVKNLTTGITYPSLGAAARAMHMWKSTLALHLYTHGRLIIKGHDLEIVRGGDNGTSVEGL